ncbi:MAG TPA: tRNA 2-selenouridine(34) synthase MnmH [Flavisolibacter sp.]|nr:tRNA 2-selenouridine(34) synthase MnmH [Flavisolibacter sp.]
MRKLAIEEFMRESKGALLLDVRSPGEFRHAHIPGAVSLPLFTDAERAVVGTEYKQVGRQAAIKTGLDYFGPKMRKMVEEVEELVRSWQYSVSNTEPPAADCQLPTANSVFVYCWRGGMRSSAVSWLLNLYGFDVTLLTGGYKAFRNYVLQSFEQQYPFKILSGYTGSGKTELLQQLKADGEKIICLETIASHKGSAFGNINMPPQPTQEMFENLLSHELRAISGEPVEATAGLQTPNPKHQTSSIWLEDESQRIGLVNIPNALWNTMRNAPLYFLDIPFEERLKHITEEYSRCEKDRLRHAVERIKKRLGGLETKNALQYLDEGNYTECFRILLHYYDKLYRKALHNRENLSALLTNIRCDTVTVQNASLVSQPINS